MNPDELNSDNLSAGMSSQRAVSLYGQNEGIEDFPVLKAFQQYIDAEQEKARKRIVGLGIVFGSVLVLVVVVFMFLLHGINMRNQSLSDRLVEYAMKESERHQSVVANQQPAASTQNDAALKAMTDTLVSLQKKLQETEEKKATPIQPTVDAEYERKMREDAAKMEKAKYQLEQEKKRLAEEKERLHQIEIDRQRRKLYPELYGEQADTSRSQSPSRARTRTLTDDDIREIIREAYPESELKKTAEAPAEPTKTESKTEKKDTSDMNDDDGAIEYYKDDEYTIPVEIKGSPSKSKAKFTVPIE